MKLLDGYNASVPINSGCIEKLVLVYNSLWPLGQRRGTDTASGPEEEEKDEWQARALQMLPYLASL